MKTDEYKALDRAQRPMVQWAALVDALDPAERAALSSAAADLAVHFARFASYVNARYLSDNHGLAVDQQNRIAKGLRKAFGFSYPQNDIRF